MHKRNLLSLLTYDKLYIQIKTFCKKNYIDGVESTRHAIQLQNKKSSDTNKFNRIKIKIMMENHCFFFPK